MTHSDKKITSVLIANRGEIAVRIIRTLRDLGIRSIAVYSEADSAAPHVRMADCAIAIGPAPVSESYLNIEKIIEAITESGADAVHPGYGLLSENPAFAKAVEATGAIWIGPSCEAMEQMGAKTDARETMSSAGVPIVPGGPIEAADGMTYPLLVKASAGGGGKGMRRVDNPEELAEAAAACAREAEKSFGDGEVYVEKLLLEPRHIEIQVLADRHGNTVHLFERECSVQRRHQKVVEESPSPGVDDALREQMGRAAVAAAEAVGYVGAGTVEFLLDRDQTFYFLEMNTRLQVEHPVTEMVVGLDLVSEQIRIAAGEPLGYSQADLSQRGHSIECRIYAEDSMSYLPQTGTISTLIVPEGPGVRHDSGICEGWTVGVHYDPMLAKLCTWGATREEAIARMARALRDYVVLGVRTNLRLLAHVVGHPRFIAGDLTTAFLDECPCPPTETPPDIAYIACALAESLHRAPTGSEQQVGGDPYSPWDRIGGWSQ